MKRDPFLAPAPETLAETVLGFVVLVFVVGTIVLSFVAFGAP